MLKKTMLFILALSSLFITACKQSIPIVTFNSGEITQEEVREELDKLNKARAESIMLNDALQEKFLQEIAEDEILYREAIKRGLDKDKAFRLKMEDEERKIKESVFFNMVLPQRTRLTGKDKRNLRYRYHVKIIFIGAAYYLPKSVISPIEMKARKAYRRIKQENATNFNQIAALVSELDTPTIPPVEYLGPVDFEVTRVIAEMKEGEIRLEQFLNGFVILYLVGKEKKQEHEILELKTNQNLLNGYRRVKTEWLAAEYRYKTILGDKVKRNYDILEHFPNEEDIILSYKGKKYSGKDFREDLEERTPGLHATKDEYEFFNNLHTNFMARIYFVEGKICYPFVANEFFRSHPVSSHPAYRDAYEEKKREMLIKYIVDKTAEEAGASAEISEDILKRFWHDYMMLEYWKPEVTEMSDGSRKQLKTPIPYEEVASRVSNDYRKQTGLKAARVWKAEFISNANIVFHRSNFVRLEKTNENQSIIESRGLSHKKEEEKNKEFFLKRFIKRIFLASRKRRIISVFSDLDKIYSVLENLSGKSLASKMRDIQVKVDKIDGKLVNLFERKKEASLCVMAAKYYYQKQEALRARAWLRRLREVEEFDISIIENMLTSDDEQWKWTVLESLEYIRDQRMFPKLKDMLQTETNQSTKIFVIGALGHCQNYKAVNVLEPYLTNEVWGLRIMAQEALKTLTGVDYNISSEN